ncbi:MAG: glycosyltransferase family 4 protein [Hyphomicrobiales bacterium]|nr:glycosyltransferase family 4 protein [Hyphomicrobiales bacterium]
MTTTGIGAQASMLLMALGGVTLSALLVSLGVNALLRPMLARHALANPNARSSHSQPTPQGGGIGVVAATLVVGWSALALAPLVAPGEIEQLFAATAGAALLGAVGAVDDVRPLSPALRLPLQCIAVAAVVAMLPAEWQILPYLPQPFERALLVVAGVWFVNLVNFMDGIDWMTVAETVPIAGAITLLGLAGGISSAPAILAAALLGATLGFAPANKPRARLFLGDVGSLPIGFLLGWLLLQLAAHGHLAAAIILPLYYLADATLTLARRLLRGERVWQAHRTHFYQRATDNGFSVLAIVTRVFLVNLVLAALAFAAVIADSVPGSAAALAAAFTLVAWLLAAFARPRR